MEWIDDDDDDDDDDDERIVLVILKWLYKASLCYPIV